MRVTFTADWPKPVTFENVLVRYERTDHALGDTCDHCGATLGDVCYVQEFGENFTLCLSCGIDTCVD